MDKGSLARTVVLVIALVNQFLTMYGLNPLPFSDEDVYNGVTVVFTIVATLIAWFKNNYITHKGKKQKEVLKKEGLTK
ncbi:phage holin [Heyndrickxia sp. FSL K6-6286]|uniref:phage holin n=1 Tax=Heyndrickxia sp. FSL K6-6286 TaxID=2921510 RepID=UPI00217F1428|nr:phage holin [Heyndrickxia oleronia]